jgi:hypothetical protein
VVSQPLNQQENHPALGKMNKELGEFWLNNPWQQDDHNLSSYERNRVLLNSRTGSVLDISHLTTADIDSDSRAIAIGDFNSDGMPDLMVRSVGGGPLRIYENRWPKTNWLRVSLKGTKSNSLGLGAKLEFHVKGQVYWRTLNPVCSYQSQLPSEVHLGLGQASQIDKLIIHWPAGTVGTFENLPVNRHLLFSEDSSDWNNYSSKK